jgi:hypothetical protein
MLAHAARVGAASLRRTAPMQRRAALQQQTRAYTAPMSEMRFLLNDVWDLNKHYDSIPETGGLNADADMTDMVLTEMAKFCENELSPLNETADREGCTWINEHEVKTPTGFKEAYDQWVEGGWQGLNYPEEYGGQGLPYSLAMISTEMAATANWTWTMYPGLSKGAINTIIAHGSDEMKDKWLPPLVEGRYTGTMCLTEPQCGSDLGLVSTKAVPNGDGTYKITGTKIFISCGEHDMVDNIVHCVLARLPGAPEGTRGISLFLVPKKKVDADGVLSDEMNGCKIGRIEDKMGCHGSSTCEINFDEAEGTLIGTENKGLNHMFTFINTSRIGTAVQGVAAAELSYQGALWYAKDRLAMRSLTGAKNEDGPADPIIVHPDVRKMLLTQRCIAEAGRSMVYECALLNDEKMEAEAKGDTDEVKRIEGQMHFLTPILKGFLTEVGVEAANLGIQVYGGHGYIKSNKQEQVLRDVRISAVWEGTTGIQALDLLGRKIMMGKLKPINEHCAKLRKEAWGLMTGGSSQSVKKHAYQLFKRACEWQYITYKIGADTASNKDALGIASVDYLMYSGYVGMAHHWLMMEEAAAKALAKGDGADLEQPKEFYEAKLQTAAFYYENILPRTETLTTTMFTPVETVMGMDAEHFSFDHAR